MGSTLFDPAMDESAVHREQGAEFSKADVPTAADVLIIGAGIIGLTSAYRLIKSGRKVTLLDPAPASEATRAAAGMLAPASEVQYRQEPLVPLMRRSAELYSDLAAQVAHDAGMAVGLRNTATLVCGLDEADKSVLLDLRGYQEKLGLATESLTVRAARKLEPALSPRISAAIHITNDHQIDPRQFATALRAILADSILPVKATEILLDSNSANEPQATGVRWEFAGSNQDTGTIDAKYIIVANGLGISSIRGIDSLAHVPLRAVHGDVIRLKVPPAQRPLIESTIRGVVRSRPVYIVPREDHTVVIGATSREDSMSGINAGGVFNLLRDARELLPTIDELEIYEVISRARPGTPDDLPLIGPITHHGQEVHRLTLANGFFRHGILLAARASEMVCNVVKGNLTPTDERDLQTCNPQRFAPNLPAKAPTNESALSQKQH